MSTIEVLPSPAARDEFWHGWLASAVATALRQLTETNEAGERVHTDDECARELRQAFDGWRESHAAQHGLAHLDERVPDGYVVESADGEAQAWRPTFESATAAISEVERYWWGAATCGHPAAPGYVDSLYPFRVRQVSVAERDELREYPAVIDRES